MIRLSQIDFCELVLDWMGVVDVKPLTLNVQLSNQCMAARCCAQFALARYSGALL